MRLLAVFSLLCLCGLVLADAPAWLTDVPNSRWIVFGGPTGIADSQGITVRDKTGEGDITPAERGGVSCAQSVIPGGRPGYYYLACEPWDRFLRNWLGDADVLLTIRYYDGAPGTMGIHYDSSDPRVKLDPYPAGVWRAPDDFPQGVQLKGTKTWMTVTTRLTLAYLTKRVHGADIRLEGLSPDIALAGVAITRVPRGADPTLQVSQELRIAKTTGFQNLGKVARCSGTFTQDGDKPIVMEAELATTATLANGRAPGADKDASGGAYLHYVDNAAFSFTVATAGKYTCWERASFPWAGGWNHEECLENGTQSGIYVDSTGTPKPGWQWVKTGTYDLAAGAHTFRLSYCGGAKLDLVAFTRETTPPDLAALKSSYQGPTTGEVWTAPVAPFDVAGWRSTAFTVAGGTATCEYSIDSGKTWTAFDPQKGLSDIAVRGGGADSIAFHLTLAGAGAPPFFAGGTLAYQAGPKNVKVVENARLKLEIDPYGVKSLFDKAANAYVSKAAQFHDPLASLVVKKPGFAPVSSLDLYAGTLEKVEIAGTAEAPVLTLAHRLANGMGLTTTAKLLPDGQSEWRLAIDNPTELEVAEIRFPIITGCALGGTASDDWIFVPKCWGQVWQNPASDRLGAYWGPAMRWMMLWDKGQGLFLDIEDPRFDDYALVYGGDSSGGATIAAAQRIRVAPHAAWTSGTYRLAVTGGDWHQGADLYRSYVVKALKPCDVSPVVKWLTDGWITQPSNDNPLIGWDVVHSSAEPYMAANRQMTDGADSGYCGLYPYPAMAWGSTQEFSQKLAVRRALGGLYTPYHNFHLWAAGYGHYPRVGTFPKALLPKGTPIPDDAWYAKASAKGYDGSYYRMETDYFAQLDMAMGSREWRDWLAYWTNAYLDWGADGMYYDQFNMIYPNGALYPDFDTYGCWVPGTLALMAKIKGSARAKNPYYSSSGEFANDVMGQFVDMHMTSGVLNRLEFFRYCLPDQLLIDGGWNGGTAAVFGGQERYRFIWQVGARFEGFPTDARITALRRAVKSLLYNARFMDTVGVTVRDAGGQPLEPEYTFAGQAQNAPVRGTTARWFLYRKDGARGAVVNLINAPVKPGATVSIDTREFGPVKYALAWTLEGACEPVKGRQDGDRYTFPVPAAELSTVVLSCALPPVVQWSLDPAAAPGVTRTLTVTVTNPNNVSMNGAAALKLPAGWSAAPAAFGPLAPGASLTFTLPVAVPATAKPGRYNIACNIDTPLGSFATYNLLVVNGPVLADFRGNPGNYHLWLKNLTDRTIAGTASVKAPAPLTASVAAAFTLPPNSETRLPVAVTGHDRVKRITELSATVTINGQPMSLVRAVIPIVPNGDFEQDTAGDRKPDWWFVRKVGDEWAYERMHLAEGAHGGKTCLLLDPPQEGEKLLNAYPEHSILSPNTRYRVSIWIKSDSPTGVYAQVMGLALGSGKTTGAWQQFTGEFRTGPGLAGLGRVCWNTSDKPAYFDDLVIEEVKE